MRVGILPMERATSPSTCSWGAGRRSFVGPVDQKRLLLGRRNATEHRVAVREAPEALDDVEVLLALLDVHAAQLREERRRTRGNSPGDLAATLQELRVLRVQQ